MPQTLPWPKMPNIAGIKRRRLPVALAVLRLQILHHRLRHGQADRLRAGRGVHRVEISFQSMMVLSIRGDLLSLSTGCSSSRARPGASL